MKREILKNILGVQKVVAPIINRMDDFEIFFLMEQSLLKNKFCFLEDVHFLRFQVHFLAPCLMIIKKIE